MLLHKLIQSIVAASAIRIKILVFRVNCQEKNEGKKRMMITKSFLESLLITIKEFGLFLPNPDFKQFLLAFYKYNSLTFLKAAYSESRKSLIDQNLKL